MGRKPGRARSTPDRKAVKARFQKNLNARILEGFEMLKKLIPEKEGRENSKLTKIQTLKLAIKYINEMRELLKNFEPQQPTLYESVSQNAQEADMTAQDGHPIVQDQAAPASSVRRTRKKKQIKLGNNSVSCSNQPAPVVDALQNASETNLGPHDECPTVATAISVPQSATETLMVLKDRHQNSQNLSASTLANEVAENPLFGNLDEQNYDHPPLDYNELMGNSSTNYGWLYSPHY